MSRDVSVVSKKKGPPWTHLLYIAPMVLLIGMFIYYSIGYIGYVSLLEWNGISSQKTFVGLANYREALQDKIFHSALGHTLIFMVATIVIQMVLGLMLAILLKSKVVGKVFYKIVFFMPVVLSNAVVAYVFRRIFDANDGELNVFFEAIGLDSLALTWLADPKLALLCLIGINVWQFTGFSFIMYFAGLTMIEKELYEAVRIDGGGIRHMVRYVTFPLLRSTHFSLVILGVIGALKTFDIVYLTTGGGPAHSTEFLSTYIFTKTLLEYNAGYASALSIVLLLAALLLTWIQLRAYRK
ncbi:carbohydrate ABC transporter permease [Cohnella hongkongensis]|uniref:Carbohydrate ABC transporter permease n=1 Tax=Cohnella hongkongensis TaxID=178337 RepID=A0ABV9FA91_9BACL